MTYKEKEEKTTTKLCNVFQENRYENKDEMR